MSSKTLKSILWLACSCFGFIWLSTGCRPMEEKEKVANGTPIDCTYSLPNLVQINKFILQNPNDAKLFRIRSQILLDSGQLKEALSDGKRALSLAPDDLFNFVVVAKAHRSLGHIDSALSACLTAEKAGFNDPDNFLLLGDLYFIIRQYGKSMEYLNRALKLAPFEPRIYYLKGLAFWETKDTAKALSNWQTAIEQDPTFADGYIKLSNFYMAQGLFSTAEQYLRSGIRLRPKDPFLNLNMGIFLSFKGYADSAISAYETALKIDPNLAMAQANLGLLKSDKKQFEEAKNLLEKALPHDPKNTTLIYHLGQCYLQTNEPEKAETEFNKIISLNRDFVKEASKGLEKVKKQLDSKAKENFNK